MLIAGKACLILVLVTSLYGIGASLYGARRHKREWVASGRRAVYAVAATTALAFVILEAAFLRSDFTFTLVTTHSSTTTPAFYRATAVWSSQEGSLLLWLLLLSLWSSLILFLTRRKLREIAPYATAVLLGLAAFFACMLVFLESPFDRTIGPAPSLTRIGARTNGDSANTSSPAKNVPKPSSTAVAYGASTRSRWRVMNRIRLDHAPSRNSHSSSEPSCEDHIAVSR